MTSSGRIILRKGVPTGDLSFGKVADGALISRTWNITFNDAPQFQSFLDNGIVDPSTMARFYDCQLLDDSGAVLAEVNEWEPVVSFETSEFRPGGQRQKWDVEMGFKVTFTMTQMLVRDGRLFSQVMGSLRPGAPANNLTLQAVYNGRGA